MKTFGLFVPMKTPRFLSVIITFLLSIEMGCVNPLSKGDSACSDTTADSISVSLDELISLYGGSGTCSTIFLRNIWLVAGELPVSWNSNNRLWESVLVVRPEQSLPDKIREIEFWFEVDPEESYDGVVKAFFGLSANKIFIKNGMSRYRETKSDGEWTSWHQAQIAKHCLPGRESMDDLSLCEAIVTLELDGISSTVPYKDLEYGVCSLKNGSVDLERMSVSPDEARRNQ